MVKYEIKIKTKNDYVEVQIPLISRGKFRCKTRNNFQEFGKGFAPKSEIITENAYVEWQIGYDKKTNDDSKKTSLKNIEFVGANGNLKNPYELAEIFYQLCQIGFIKKNEIKNLINTIEKTNKFFKEKHEIHSEILKKTSFNNEDFYESIITLPTFNKKNKSCDMIIQISIEKQQYATGVQPMLYLNIPIYEFENKDKIIGHTSQKEKYGILKIDQEKSEVFKNIFICFGMCSDSHHHDILKILEKIYENL